MKHKGEISQQEFKKSFIRNKLGEKGPDLVASLGLSDENEGVGAYDGEAEVDEDDRTL